jgi:hypothetical protein
MWAEVSSSAPHFLQSGLSLSPIKWRCLYKVLCPVRSPVTPLIDKLQTDLNRLGEWTIENKMKIHAGKSETVSFTKSRVKDSIRYYFGDQLIPEASNFKYLGIITRSDLNWANHVNYKLDNIPVTLCFNELIHLALSTGCDRFTFCTTFTCRY